MKKAIATSPNEATIYAEMSSQEQIDALTESSKIEAEMVRSDAVIELRNLDKLVTRAVEDLYAESGVEAYSTVVEVIERKKELRKILAQ